MKTQQIKIGQKIKVPFQNKKFEAIVLDVFSDCVGVEVPFGAPFGITYKKTDSSLAKKSTFFLHEIEAI